MEIREFPFSIDARVPGFAINLLNVFENVPLEREISGRCMEEFMGLFSGVLFRGREGGVVGTEGDVKGMLKSWEVEGWKLFRVIYVYWCELYPPLLIIGRCNLKMAPRLSISRSRKHPNFKIKRGRNG